MKIAIAYPGTGPHYAAVSTVFAFLPGVTIVEEDEDPDILITGDRKRLQPFLLRGGIGIQYLLNVENYCTELAADFPATFRAFRAKQVDAEGCDLPDQDEMKRFVERLVRSRS